MPQNHRNCSVCGAEFELHFRYQVEERVTAGEDGRDRVTVAFFCSQRCLEASHHARSGGSVQCDACASSFEVELAYQVLFTGGRRHYACSPACRSRIRGRCASDPAGRASAPGACSRIRRLQRVRGRTDFRHHPCARVVRRRPARRCSIQRASSLPAPPRAPVIQLGSGAPARVERRAASARDLQPQGRHREDHDRRDDRGRPRCARAARASGRHRRPGQRRRLSRPESAALALPRAGHGGSGRRRRGFGARPARCPARQRDPGRRRALSRGPAQPGPRARRSACSMYAALRPRHHRLLAELVLAQPERAGDGRRRALSGRLRLLVAGRRAAGAAHDKARQSAPRSPGAACGACCRRCSTRAPRSATKRSTRCATTSASAASSRSGWRSRSRKRPRRPRHCSSTRPGRAQQRTIYRWSRDSWVTPTPRLKRIHAQGRSCDGRCQVSDRDDFRQAAAKVLDASEVEGVLEIRLLHAPRGDGPRRARREAGALQGDLHLDVHRGPEAARSDGRLAQGPRPDQGQPQRADPLRARRSRTWTPCPRGSDPRGLPVSSCLAEACARAGVTELDYVDHRSDPAAWADELGISREAVELYLASDVIDLHLDSFIWQRVFGYDLRRRHGRGLFDARFYSQVDFPRALEAGLTGATWVITTNPLRSAAERLRSLLLESARAHRAIRERRPIASAWSKASPSIAPRAPPANTAPSSASRAATRSTTISTRSTASRRASSCAPRSCTLSSSSFGATSSPLRRRRRSGLTDHGRAFIRRLNEKKIFVDLAHISKKGFWDALEVHDRSQPLLVTHTGVSGVFEHWRNLDDAQLRAIADSGGTIGVMYHSSFLGQRREQPPKPSCVTSSTSSTPWAKTTPRSAATGTARSSRRATWRRAWSCRGSRS